MDALVESSNAIEAGGIHGITALQHNIHLIMMNYEADLMYGPLLMSIAEQNDLVYTACDGDQPAVIKRLVDEILLWGFELVLAGNIKWYLDHRANPTTIIPEADKRKLDYRMCTSYTDGSKLNVEMAVLANALGLCTAVPGMLGPRVKHVRDVFEHFDLDGLWQEKRQLLVDYVLGAEPHGGVFVIDYTSQAFQQFALDWYPPDMWPGPYYLFFRSYHLGHIEAMACVAEAVLDGRTLLKPDHGFQTNVFSYARRDLRQGDVLDGVGGYTCHGLIENMVDDERQHAGKYMGKIRTDEEFVEKELARLLVDTTHKLEGPISLKQLRLQFSHTVRHIMIKRAMDPGRLRFWKRRGQRIEQWRKSLGLDAD